MDAVLCVFVLLISQCSSIDFSGQSRSCEPKNGQTQNCVPIDGCWLYQTAASVRQHRPQPCGFQGRVPLVCCPQYTPTPSFECGNPNRTIYHSIGFVSTPPAGTARPGRPVTLSERHVVTRRRRSRQHQTVFAEEEMLVRAPCSRPHGCNVHQAVGGFDAELGRWPWIALFGRWSGQELGGWFCGGSLISPDYVLTAAHCISPNNTDTIGVRIGDHDLSTNAEVRHQERRITWIRQHQEYRGSQNDIALVKLQSRVDLTDAVRPICLPPSGNEYGGRLGVAMAGWGHLEFRGSEVPDVLQEVRLQLADIGKCESAYREVISFNTEFPGGFQNTKLCAVSPDDEPRDACDGDSGGPLMVETGQGLYELIGIVSTGVGCGNPDFPGIYTKVSAYIPWIEENAV